MRKYIIFTLLLVFPMFVQAEECTNEMIKEYEQSAAKIVITPSRLDNSNTFEIWVKGVTNGLVVEHGRTVLDEGFLGYAQAGDNYVARVYVGYGACNGQTIKEIKVALPNEIEKCGDDCSQEEVTTPPTVVEKPTTDTEKETPTVEIPKKENTTTNNTSTSGKTEETTVEKPSVEEEVKEKEDIDNDENEIIQDDSLDNEQNFSNNETNSFVSDEDETVQSNETTDTTTISDGAEKKHDNIHNDIIIFATFSFLAIILYIIFRNKKIKLSK